MRKMITDALDNLSCGKKKFAEYLQVLETTLKNPKKKLAEEERKELFWNIENLMEEDKEEQIACNTLMLAKYVIAEVDFLEEYFPAYLDWLLWAVDYKYEDVRLVSEFLARDLGFLAKYVSEDNLVKYIETFLMLQRKETLYQDDNRDKLCDEEYFDGMEFVEIEDTNDTVLKSIRIAMSFLDGDFLMNLMNAADFLAMFPTDDPEDGGGRYIPEEIMEMQKEIEQKFDESYTNIMDEDFSPEGIEKKRKQIESAFNFFVESNSIDLSFDTIKNMVYDSSLEASVDQNEYYSFVFDLCEEYEIEISQNLLELFTSCRNYFPHKALDGKSPVETMADFDPENLDIQREVLFK